MVAVPPCFGVPFCDPDWLDPPHAASASKPTKATAIRLIPKPSSNETDPLQPVQQLTTAAHSLSNLRSNGMPRTAQGSEKRTLVTRAVRYLGAWKEVPDMHVVLIPN